jgi:hypothetical protein
VCPLGADSIKLFRSLHSPGFLALVALEKPITHLGEEAGR